MHDLTQRGMMDGTESGTGEAHGAGDFRIVEALPFTRPPDTRDVVRAARVSLEVLAIAGVYLFLVLGARDTRLPRTSKVRQREARTAVLLAAREEEIDRTAGGS